MIPSLERVNQNKNIVNRHLQDVSIKNSPSNNHKSLDSDNHCKRNTNFPERVHLDGKSITYYFPEATSYLYVSDIGTGSFGKAVLIKERYVMKIIETTFLKAKEKDNAINEVTLLSSLKHPYIISYKESFYNDMYLGIVMDYADGGDLFKIINNQKKRGMFFTEKQILRWFTQATLALKYLHEKHILHRDLKTQNLFLMSNSRLKLGDFGIAKALDGTACFAKTQIGTPYYISPEICKNQPYSWSSDIWSLGCILFELATLKLPFQAQHISILLNRIISEPAPTLPDTYSSALRDLCSSCLERDWKKRPSAAEILRKAVIQNEIKSMLLEEHNRRKKNEIHSNRIPSSFSIEKKSSPLTNKNISNRKYENTLGSNQFHNGNLSKPNDKSTIFEKLKHNIDQKCIGTVSPKNNDSVKPKMFEDKTIEIKYKPIVDGSPNDDIDKLEKKKKKKKKYIPINHLLSSNSLNPKICKHMNTSNKNSSYGINNKEVIDIKANKINSMINHVSSGFDNKIKLKNSILKYMLNKITYKIQYHRKLDSQVTHLSPIKNVKETLLLTENEKCSISSVQTD